MEAVNAHDRDAVAGMQIADDAVARVLAEVLRPDRVERALDLAVRILTTERETPTRDAIARRLADVERELKNLAETAARGGAVPAVLDALAKRDRTGNGCATRSQRARAAGASSRFTPRTAQGIPERLERDGERQRCRGPAASRNRA